MARDWRGFSETGGSARYGGAESGGGNETSSYRFGCFGLTVVLTTSIFQGAYRILCLVLYRGNVLPFAGRQLRFNLCHEGVFQRVEDHNHTPDQAKNGRIETHQQPDAGYGALALGSQGDKAVEFQHPSHDRPAERKSQFQCKQGGCHNKRCGTAAKLPLSEVCRIGIDCPLSHRNGSKEERDQHVQEDRKSTRLNSSHVAISYAVFCSK